jgi:hypothetical protein
MFTIHTHVLTSHSTTASSTHLETPRRSGWNEMKWVHVVMSCSNVMDCNGGRVVFGLAAKPPRHFRSMSCHERIQLPCRYVTGRLQYIIFTCKPFRWAGTCMDNQPLCYQSLVFTCMHITSYSLCCRALHTQYQYKCKFGLNINLIFTYIFIQRCIHKSINMKIQV